MGPDRLETWWDLAGPASFLEKVTRAIASAERVIAIQCPDPRPEGFGEALIRKLGRDLALETVRIDVSTRDQTGSIAHLLGEEAGVPAVEIAQVEDFATHPALVDKVLVVDGIDREETLRWGLFLRALASEKIPGTIVGPVVVALLPVGIDASRRGVLTGRSFNCTIQGRVTRNDTIAHLARLGVRPADDPASKIGHAVCIDVAAWSRPMLEHMAAWNLDDQIDPSALLYRLAEKANLPYPCWENGLVDLWDDEPVAHPVAAFAHQLIDHVKRRVWSAQAAIVLPLADRIRRGLIGRYRDVLNQRVSEENPYVREVNGFQKRRTDPSVLEFYEIQTVLRDILPPDETALIRAAKAARDCAAHMDPMSPFLVRRLSEHYEANRDILECEIPGWDWPRVGQTMTLTVGPSAAGKSTWSATQGQDVVSSDAIRDQMSADGKSKSGQSEVFNQVRKATSRILTEGRNVIVDATHLKAHHRKRQVLLAPPDIAVRYVVIDRPLGDKQRDAGWRAEKGIVELHHDEFESGVEAALSGDGLPNVTVEDLR